MPVFCQLGDFVFANNEVPQSIPFGGSQRLSIKKLVGGERVIDSMGRDDLALTWSGRFRGSTGLLRAQFLDGMRVSGKAYRLSWSQLNYLVVIRDFHPDFLRFYEIPYTITVEVIQDLNKPFPLLVPVAYNDAIRNAVIEAQDLALTVRDKSVSASLALLAQSINAIPSLSNATSAALATITGPLNSAFSSTTGAIANLSSGTFS